MLEAKITRRHPALLAATMTLYVPTMLLGRQRIPGGFRPGAGGKMHDGVDPVAELFEFRQVIEPSGNHLAVGPECVNPSLVAADHEPQVIAAVGVLREVRPNVPGGAGHEDFAAGGVVSGGGGSFVQCIGEGHWSFLALCGSMGKGGNESFSDRVWTTEEAGLPSRAARRIQKLQSVNGLPAAAKAQWRNSACHSACCKRTAAA